MGSFKKYTSYFLRSLLLFLFIGYYSSITMFYHAHLVNGQILSHSHPYKPDKNNKTPYESHPHTSSAYNFIRQLNDGNWKDTSSIVWIPTPVIYNSEICWLYVSAYVNPADCEFTSLRGPPPVIVL